MNKMGITDDESKAIWNRYFNDLLDEIPTLKSIYDQRILDLEKWSNAFIYIDTPPQREEQ